MVGVGAVGVVPPPALTVVELPPPFTAPVPVAAVVTEAVVAAVVVDVVATCWGANGLWPLPASFVSPGVDLTEIAGSVVPEE